MVLTARDVTVVVPTFDAAATVTATLESIVGQSAGSPHVVLVDDGSTDSTVEVVERFAAATPAASISVVRQGRGGPGAARNAGLALVSTAIVAFCDADDRWVPDRLLADLADLDADPSVDVLLGRSRFEAADGRLLRGLHFGGAERVATIPHFGAATVRTAAIGRIGPIDATLVNFEDYDWFLRVRDVGVRVVEHDRVSQIRTLRRESASHVDPATPSDLLAVVQRSVRRRRSPRPLPRPMRLMWWLPEYPPNLGGIGALAALVVPELARRGHELHLHIGWEREDGVDELPAGVTAARRPLRRAFEARDAVAIHAERRALVETKRAFRPDVYHLHPTEPSTVLHLATATVEPAPTVLTLHNESAPTFVTDSPNSMMAQLLETAAVVTAVSSGAARMATAADRRLANKIVTIPNAVDPPAAFVEPPAAPSVLAVGRLVHQKAFERLVRAVPAVVASLPGVSVDIVGSGPQREALVALAEDLGVADVVTFHGRLDRAEVGRRMDAASVVVAPSRYEGMPLAVLEAGRHGRPVVATRIGGVDEVVVDGVTGVLVDEGVLDAEPERLAAAIVEVAGDAARGRAMGLAARERVGREFSLAACVDAYEEVYRSVLAPVVDVAVIVPAWNAERHVADALESALAAVAMAGVSADVLVVDDGSTDATADVVAGFAGRGVRSFRQPNQGAGMARNAGVALTRSRFVAHLDADDRWPPDRLVRLLAAFGDGQGDLDAVFGAVVEFADPDAPATARWSAEPQVVRAATVGVVRRSAIERIGGFAMSQGDDQIEWSTHALTHGLTYSTIDAVVLERRVHATNTSHRRPFLSDTARLAVLKAALDARRGAPSP